MTKEDRREMRGVAIVFGNKERLQRFETSHESYGTVLVNTDCENMLIARNATYCEGSQWQATLAFLLYNREMWSQYDYLWFIGPHVNLSSTQIATFFHTVTKHQSIIAQPCDPNSWQRDLHFKQNKSELRTVSFVESNAPCFTRAFVQAQLLPFLQDNRDHLWSGWGIDLWWSSRDHQRTMVVNTVTLDKERSRVTTNETIAHAEKTHFCNKYNL